MTHPAPQSTPLWPLAILVVAIGLAAAYSNSLRNGFHLDDHYGITPNPCIRSLALIPSYFTDPFTYSTHRENVDYRPMVTATYAVNYAISGYEPWSWHLLNLALHALVCLSLFALGRALLGTGRIADFPGLRERDGDVAALAAAAIFAVHPITAACANYMWARSSLLVAAAVLPATVAYLRAVQRGSGPLAALAALLFTIALFAKPEAISFLAVAAMVEFLFAPARRSEPLHRRLIPRWGDLRLLPLLAIAGGYLVIRAGLLPEGQPKNWAAADLSRWQYLFTQFGAWWYYVGKLLAPVNLIADYAGYASSRSLAEPRVIGALAAWLVVGALLAGAARRAPAATLLGAAFFIQLSPTSSIVPLAEMVNEHRPYLPVSGLVLLGVAGGVAAIRAIGWPPAPVAAAATLALAVPLTLLTRDRNGVFLNGLTYWQDVAAKDPRSGRAQMNLALELWRAGRPEEAGPRFHEAVRLLPNWPFAHVNLGLYVAAHGDLAAARSYLDRAVELAPRSSIPFYHRGQFRLAHGDTGGAISDFESAVRYASIPSRERAALADALLRAGRHGDAAEVIRQGEAIDPGAFAELRARLP